MDPGTYLEYRFLNPGGAGEAGHRVRPAPVRGAHRVTRAAGQGTGQQCTGSLLCMCPM